MQLGTAHRQVIAETLEVRLYPENDNTPWASADANSHPNGVPRAPERDLNADTDASTQDDLGSIRKRRIYLTE
jgi:hypothetical protein